MKNLFFAALATLVVLAVMPAAAATLYSQPPLALPNLGASWTSTLDNTDSGFIAWDNFTVASNSSVTSVSWRGFAWDFINTANNPVNLQTTDWLIAIFADANGAPGTALLFDNVVAASVGTTLIGTGSFNGDTVNVYDFTYTFSAPFAATGGTQYWFTPVSSQVNFNPIFSWSEGTGGDNQTFQCAYANGVATSCQNQGGDRAFSLYGTAVPEPSSLALLGTGLAALAGVVRRRLS